MYPEKKLWSRHRKLSDATGISVSLSANDLEQIDAAAKQAHMNRSEFIVNCATGRHSYMNPGTNLLIAGIIPDVESFIVNIGKLIEEKLMGKLVNVEISQIPSEQNQQSVFLEIAGCDANNLSRIIGVFQEVNAQITKIIWLSQ